MDQGELGSKPLYDSCLLEESKIGKEQHAILHKCSCDKRDNKPIDPDARNPTDGATIMALHSKSAIRRLRQHMPRDGSVDLHIEALVGKSVRQVLNARIGAEKIQGRNNDEPRPFHVVSAECTAAHRACSHLTRAIASHPLRGDHPPPAL